MSRVARSRSSARTAQCSGVVPSGSAAFTSAGCFSRRSTACRSPAWIASERRAAPPAPDTDTVASATTSAARATEASAAPLRKEVLDAPIAVAEAVQPAAVLVGDRQPQVAHRCLLAHLDVPVPLAGSAAHGYDRQRVAG